MSLSAKVPFRVKLCGFRRASDIEAAIEAGADAIGINFSETSPRFIRPEEAAQVVRVGLGRVLMVGVFVNASLETIRATLRICPLDMLQLHGDETPELVSSRNLPPIIKATPWREKNQEDARNALSWSSQAEATNLAGILIDAYDPVQRGGTGRVARWDLLYPRPIELSRQPLILAGGLTEKNVAEAIRISRVDAVDTASGVEIEPGIKDRAKMQRFVVEAKKGFESAK